MLNDQLQQDIDHWQHSARRSATWLGGQGLRLLTGTSVASLAVRGAHPLTYWLGSLGIGLSIGVRVYMENDKHKEDMKFFASYYRPEISAVLGIDGKNIGEDELRAAAAHVPNLQEAVDRADRERRAKVIAWIGGGLLAGIALFAVAVPILSGIAFLEANAWALGLAAFGVNSVLFPLGKTIVETGVNKLMHIGDSTAHHYIEKISRDLNKTPQETISQERVFEVFLAANPAVREQLEGALNQSYDKLDHATHEIILKQYSEVLHLAEITDDLNRKLIRPQELAFITHGMASGVKRLDVPPVSATEEATRKLDHTLEQGRDKAKKVLHKGEEKIQNLRHHAAEKVHAMRESIHHHPAAVETKADWQQRVDAPGVKSTTQSWGDYTSERGIDALAPIPR